MSDQSVLRGTTLVELLVVISAITVLLSLLVPTLSRVRAVARQTLCRSQLRQWGLCFQMYANETDYYPHIDGLDRQGDNKPVLPKDWADYFGWIDMLPPLMGERPWRDYGRREHPRAGTIYQCPEAKIGLDSAYTYRPSRNGFFSYAMNSCLELDENCWHHPEDTHWPMPSFLQTDLIRSPGRTILLFDQLLDPASGYDASQSYGNAGKHCGSYPKSFSVRHAKPGGLLGGLVLYCDYHVEWKQSVWKSHWPDDLEVPPRDDPDWYPY